MFKTVKTVHDDIFYQFSNDALVKELKLLEGQAEELGWNLLLDTDIGQFGLLSPEGVICQYSYQKPGSYQADTASVALTRNLVTLFVEKFQTISDELEQLRRKNEDLSADLREAKKNNERLSGQLNNAECKLSYERRERKEAQEQLRVAQTELAKLKEASGGIAATTDAGMSA